MSKNDKSKLITLVTMLLLIVIIAAFNMVTRTLPLIILFIALAVVSLVVLTFVCKEYLAVYGIHSSISTYIPIINLITIFPASIAYALIGASILTILCFCLGTVPADTFVTVLGEAQAYKFVSTIPRLCLASCLLLWFVISAGVCAVLRDVREMLTTAIGSKQPMLELVYYFVLFFPIASLAAYAFVLTEIQKLRRTGYTPGDAVQNDRKDLFSEVQK